MLHKALQFSSLTLLWLTLPILLLVVPIAGLPAFGVLSIGYVVLMPLLVGWQMWLARRSKLQNIIGLTGFILAAIGALGCAAPAGPLYMLIASVVAAGLCFIIGQTKHNSAFYYLAAACVYLAIAQLTMLAYLGPDSYAATFSALGILTFALGYKVTKTSEPDGATLRYIGLVGPFLASLLCVLGGAADEAPIVALALGGLLLGTESILTKSLVLLELAGCIVLAAYNWLLVTSHIFQVHYFILPWAVYFAYLSVKHNLPDHETEHNVLLALALAVITFPLALIATFPDGALYGLELIFVGLTLSIVGSALPSMLTLWWGLSAAFIEALYILPKFILPSSDIPFITGSVGLVVVAISVLIHAGGRREEED